MVLGKLPVPGRPTNFNYSRQWPIALAVGAGVVVWTFTFVFVYHFSLFVLPLSGRRPAID